MLDLKTKDLFSKEVNVTRDTSPFQNISLNFSKQKVHSAYEVCDKSNNEHNV